MPSTSSTRKSLPKPARAASEHVCEFCRQSFVRESTLLHHSCEPKRRHLQRDEKPVKLAFIAYQKFYAQSLRRKTPPTYDAFAKSKLYTSFVRFGRHLMELNAVNPLGYIDFLLRIEATIDRWLSPTLYDTYIRELNKNETPMDALERSLGLMQQWATESNQDWRDFFRKIEGPLAALYITNGRISPWVLFIASSAQDMMQRFNAEQLAMIERSIDPQFWRLKIERHHQDVETIREVLAEYGI